MELEILEEKENVLLKRKELKINIKHPNSPTPKKQDLVKEIASRYSVPEDHVFVNYIFTKKGVQESMAKVKIYQELPKQKQKEVKSEAQTSEAK
jgi:ribosomal protein S24E